MTCNELRFNNNFDDTNGGEPGGRSCHLFLSIYIPILFLLNFRFNTSIFVHSVLFLYFLYLVQLENLDYSLEKNKKETWWPPFNKSVKNRHRKSGASKSVAKGYTWVVVTVDTLGSMTAGELEEVGMWTLVVGVTAAIRGGMSGAMLVGRTAAVGVVMSEIGLLLLLVVTCRFQRPLWLYIIPQANIF